MNDLHDRIAQALGVGRSNVDPETQISALVALVTAVDLEHTEHIDGLQEKVDDLEGLENEMLREQVRWAQRNQHTVAALIDLLTDFQAESFEIEAENEDEVW